MKVIVKRYQTILQEKESIVKKSKDSKEKVDERK